MTELEDIPLRMLRPTLDDLPRRELPEGFALRLYRPGNADAWVRIHELADFLNDVTHRTFDKQFGYDLAAMEDRCYFLLDEAGEEIGTATAWYDDDFHGCAIGRVHWVAIVPAFQGRGLAWPLMAAVMDRLARSHDRVYLSTNSPRLPAIHLYLKMGFRPFMRIGRDADGWEQVRRSLAHPLLDAPPMTPEDL